MPSISNIIDILYFNTGADPETVLTEPTVVPKRFWRV